MYVRTRKELQPSKNYAVHYYNNAREYIMCLCLLALFDESLQVEDDSLAMQSGAQAILDKIIYSCRYDSWGHDIFSNVLMIQEKVDFYIHDNIYSQMNEICSNFGSSSQVKTGQEITQMSLLGVKSIEIPGEEMIIGYNFSKESVKLTKEMVHLMTLEKDNVQLSLETESCIRNLLQQDYSNYFEFVERIRYFCKWHNMEASDLEFEILSLLLISIMKVRTKESFKQYSKRILGGFIYGK